MENNLSEEKNYTLVDKSLLEKVDGVDLKILYGLYSQCQGADGWIKIDYEKLSKGLQYNVLQVKRVLWRLKERNLILYENDKMKFTNQYIKKP